MQQNIKDLLLMGWGAGGDPETAFLVAKANRLKGKLIAIINAIKQDLVDIWHAFIGAPFGLAFSYAEYSSEPLKYAVNSFLKGAPMVCEIRSQRHLGDACNIARGMRKELRNTLRIITLKVLCVRENEYLLITPKN